jgi:hypothetical protein
MKDNPQMMDGLLSMGLEWLGSQGYESQKVLRMVKDYAPILGISVDSDSIPSLREGLFELASRIEESDDTPDVNAVIVCPYCTELFTV